MFVPPVEITDIHGRVEAYSTRFDGVAANPGLGTHALGKRPSWDAEALWWGKFFTGVEKGDSVAFVAEGEGRVVGMAAETRKGNHVEDPHVGVPGFSLVPGSRGKGLGDQLMNALKPRLYGEVRAPSAGGHLGERTGTTALPKARAHGVWACTVGVQAQQPLLRRGPHVAAARAGRDLLPRPHPEERSAPSRALIAPSLGK